MKLRRHPDRLGFSVAVPYRGSDMWQIVLSVRVGRRGRGVHFDGVGLRRALRHRPTA